MLDVKLRWGLPLNEILHKGLVLLPSAVIFIECMQNQYKRVCVYVLGLMASLIDHRKADLKCH
jgi:hypothetical protein